MCTVCGFLGLFCGVQAHPTPKGRDPWEAVLGHQGLTFVLQLPLSLRSSVVGD